jgi:hypothetical protein
MRALIGVAVAALMAVPVAAQEAAIIQEQNRCWLGSISFSPGAAMRAGDAVMKCSDDFKWIMSNSYAAGCILAGKFYHSGAIENGPNQQAIKQRCEDDGSWMQIGPLPAKSE